MNWSTWLKGLAAAVISGSATGTTQVIATTGTVNKGTGYVALAGAILGFANYLMKSPLTPADPNTLTQNQAAQIQAPIQAADKK